MTPEEWERCTDPQELLRFLRAKASERKLRLFAVACCRRLWPWIGDGSRARAAVETAERFADGACSAEELRAAEAGVSREVIEWENWVPYESADKGSLEATHAALAATDVGWHAAGTAAMRAQQATWEGGAVFETDKKDRRVYPLSYGDTARASERVAQASPLRFLFGNPFRPPPAIVPAVLAYNGGAARRLAEAIYEGRRFGDLPILADLLEVAGLTDAALLGHLRGLGPHVLGCFALDLLLGRS
jgi:hypothetical protein